MNNSVVWVDIPVAKLDRAIAFYSAMLGQVVEKESGPGFSFGLLPHAEVGGCLVEATADSQPSRTGALVYLNAEGRLAQALDAVKAQGGQVLQDTHPIGPHGWRAIVLDSEGNRIALHSMSA